MRMEKMLGNGKENEIIMDEKECVGWIESIEIILVGWKKKKMENIEKRKIGEMGVKVIKEGIKIGLDKDEKIEEINWNENWW